MILKCPTCGQPMQGARERAPFNPHALTRIKNGATAAELGWDQSFYESVCRKHGLPILKLPEPDKPDAPQTPPVAPDAMLSPYHYDAATGVLRTDGNNRVRLLPPLNTVFLPLARLGAGGRLSGKLLGVRAGLSRQHVCRMVQRLRTELAIVGLGIHAGNGRGSQGYRLVDADNHNPVRVRVT